MLEIYARGAVVLVGLLINLDLIQTRSCWADKLLNIVSYVFNDYKNSGVDFTPSGHFDFSWLDQATAGPSSADTWTLRTVFDAAVTGDATNPPHPTPVNATGTLNYTLTVTDPNAQFASVEIDSAHLGTGELVTKSIAGLSPTPYLTSTDGSSQTKPLSGTFVDVTDSYSVPAQGGINSFSNGFTQSIGVPGPLPLFGVGAAFGFSRRLRNRIKGSRLA